RRRQNARLYNELLKDVPGVQTPYESPKVKAVYHLYVIRVAADRRQKLQNHLQSRGISTGIHYPIALPNLKAYAYLGHKKEDFPVASPASQEIASLPLYAELDADQTRYICDAVREAF